VNASTAKILWLLWVPFIKRKIPMEKDVIVSIQRAMMKLRRR
jgi:hypothetical protein